MIFQSLTIMALIAVQWIFWGYTLSFSRTGRSAFIGDFSNFLLWNVRSPLSLSLRPRVVLPCLYIMLTGNVRTIYWLRRPSRGCLLLL